MDKHWDKNVSYLSLTKCSLLKIFVKLLSRYIIIIIRYICKNIEYDRSSPTLKGTKLKPNTEL